MGAKWNLAGVTALNQLVEDSTYIPAAGGRGNTIVLQQAGFLGKLRGWLDADVLQTVCAAGPTKSTWGALGGSVRRLLANVHGRKPFYDISGLGLSIYNEVNNPDGSVFAPYAYLVGAGDVVMAESTHLTTHTAGGAGAQTYHVQQPFELPFAMPLWMTRLLRLGTDYIPVQAEEEVGLWHLQDPATRMNVEVNFFPSGILAAAIDPQAPYWAVDLVSTWSTEVNRIRWERELFDVPPHEDELPNQGYIHQVKEYTQPIVGSAFRFPIPQVGALLRVIFIFLDAANCLVDWNVTMPTATIALTFGASDTPIVRPMWALIDDFLQDYHRYPPDGVAVLDFYKAGRRAARLARDTDRIANMALVGVTTGLAAGSVRIILESLIPHKAST